MKSVAGSTIRVDPMARNIQDYYVKRSSNSDRISIQSEEAF